MDLGFVNVQRGVSIKNINYSNMSELWTYRETNGTLNSRILL
ncbi:hypothetical protein SBF1_3680002 [Candidatus Desulfosporosinus infrequens]|uniref:Uncharacterized protein n=1 Tax=Candidatus Desulfosporosinus infrequens TaxID=2043169 RepID=A0A2U3L4N8_9FIRM|nr:hypothetical protein SBF1_3680002 [Candidatus Desulfosporosinus infrequens]